MVFNSKLVQDSNLLINHFGHFSIPKPKGVYLIVKLVGAVFVPVYEILNPIVTDPPAGIEAL